MKSISIVWTVIIGIVEVILALFISAVAADSYEKLVLGILIVIYATIRSVGAGLSMIHLEKAMPDIRFKHRILELLKAPDLQNSDEWDKEFAATAAKISHWINKAHIQMATISIVYLIGLSQIISNT